MVKAVVLAGGSSPSLFPVARDSLPKQFKKLGKQNVFVPIDEEKEALSSFQNIVRLASKIGEVVVLTKKKYRFVVKGQLEELGLPATVIYDEDLGVKNLNDAYEKIIKNFPGEKIVFLPSDHVIPKESEEKFLNTIKKALDEGGVTTIVTPIFDPKMPISGYVKVENGIVTEYSHELPDDADLNEWHWHTGIIITDRPGVVIEGAHAVIGLYKWRELNNYNELENFENKDAVKIMSEESFVYSESDRKYALVGVNNVGVIDVGDFIVVYDKKKPDAGKKIYKLFEGTDLTRFGPTVYKPWGRFTNIYNGKKFKIKLLEILPGKSISLQKHFHRSEHWIVVEGTAEVRVGNKEIVLKPGESTFVPVGVVHKVSNPGKIVLKIVEVQYGEYLGDDDIVRLEDPYGRSEEEKLL